MPSLPQLPPAEGVRTLGDTLGSGGAQAPHPPGLRGITESPRLHQGLSSSLAQGWLSLCSYCRGGMARLPPVLRGKRHDYTDNMC